MQHTTNYDLNQWDAEDRVTREDFNADNAAIDAALTALAGGAKVAYGRYTGNGKYGANNPNTLTFPFQPKFLILFNPLKNNVGKSNTHPVYLDAASVKFTTYHNDTITDVTLTVDGNRVSWYSTASFPELQLNASNTKYHYIAFG